MKHITLVIPAHNEGKKIEETANRLLRDSSVNRLVNFLFIVDGSLETREAVRRAIPRGNGAKVLFFEKPLGKGKAVWEGFLASDTEYVGFLDADEPVALADVERMCGRILEGRDCVIASRKKIHNRNPVRAVLSRGFNFIVRALFPFDLPDTQCGFKLFRKGILGSRPLLIESYAFDVELLLRVLRNGGNITTCPVESLERQGGKFSLLDAPRMLIDLLRLKLSPYKDG